jgi:RNA polymerase-binding transcription factor DksA
MNREELLAKRDELRERLEQIRQDIRGGVDADAEERVDQIANREVLEGIYRSTEAELARIEEKIRDTD